MRLFDILFRRRQKSVLQALRENDPQAALKLLSKSRTLDETDPDGLVALHYAAAFGHLKLIEGILQTGAPVDVTNNLGQTPLVYAMMYDQLEGARLLWRHQSASFQEQEGDHYSKLLLQLCEIGVDRTLPPDDASSGFYVEAAEQHDHHHPRARDIGEELFAMGGHSKMQAAAGAVAVTLGSKAAHDLSACWHGVGTWLH